MILIRLFCLVSFVAALPVAFDQSAQKSTLMNKRGIWDSLLSLFNSDSSELTAGTAPSSLLTIAASTANLVNTAATPVNTAANTVNTVITDITTTAVFKLQQLHQRHLGAGLQAPAFTGLVTVIGAGGTQAPTASAGSTESSSSNSEMLDSQIQAVAKYAEMGAGISYSPYTKDGQCKTASQVKLDIEMLLGHTLIRLYSVDCSGIENVVAAMLSSQKLFLGIWDITAVDTDLPSMAQQVLTGNRGWSAVHTVAIGNEVVNSARGTAAQVASAVSSARSWFKLNAPDYTGYIVTVDTLAATMADSSLCDISDYLAVNCHPYFSGIEASTSGTWLKHQIDSLQSFCGGSKQILVTESGWPTQGNTEGQAVPSVANQLLAVKGLGTVLGDQVLMFTTFNDYWKAPGPWNVEQHWGIYGDPKY
ncbi:hypothetical protein HF325_001299 [Metschnikowia pulcherrima]|uniref:Uncharacterized protein n=1 Tax=Metschnikowia pulcherrima TaxID=27326 RepID=A0A8H7LBF2_9ASCO|nr:hypothetical protein HF325_001299 [Metschnikowia pulcherrima]